MKTVLVLINLSGLFLTVDSACDAKACTTPAGTPQSCSALQTYIDCLKDEKSGCTSSQSTMDNTLRTIIISTEDIADNLSCVKPGCDAGTCKLSSTVSCSVYKTMLTCLSDEKKKCNSSDTVNSGLIDTAITTNEAAQKALKCSGEIVALSVSTLILSLLAFYMTI